MLWWGRQNPLIHKIPSDSPWLRLGVPNLKSWGGSLWDSQALPQPPSFRDKYLPSQESPAPCSRKTWDLELSSLKPAPPSHCIQSHPSCAKRQELGWWTSDPHERLLQWVPVTGPQLFFLWYPRKQETKPQACGEFLTVLNVFSGKDCSLLSEWGLNGLSFKKW